MKKLYRVVLFSLILSAPAVVNAQILISLIFGEALNTEKIEFGLMGGFNQTYIRTISDAEGLNNFNIGFFFHIQTMKNSYLSTGVQVKSNMGATGMPTYPIGDPDFDDVYSDGILTKKIPGFYVPILFQQRFNQRWYIEAGPQLGLIYKPTDRFDIEGYGGDLAYVTSTRGQYQYFDFGFYGAVGFKVKKKQKSTSLGIGYYIGVSDVAKSAYPEIRTSSLYVFCKLPIGIAKEDQDPE